MNEFFQSISPRNITGRQLAGFLAGIVAGIFGFYAFMVSEWWGYNSFSVSLTKTVKGVTTTTSNTDTTLNTAMNLQGFLGVMTIIGLILVLWGIWGIVTLDRPTARFWSALLMLIGACTIVGVIVANVHIKDKVGEHYFRGAGFGGVLLACLIWNLWIYREHRRTPAPATPAVPII